MRDYLDSDKGQGGIFNPINLNVYNYGANNPIKYFDPTGEENKNYIVAIVFRNTKSYDYKYEKKYSNKFTQYSKNNSLDTVFLVNAKTGEYTRYDNVQTVANDPRYNKYKKGKDPTVKPGRFKFAVGLKAEYTPSDALGISDANSISNGLLEKFYEENGNFGRVLFHSNTPAKSKRNPNPKPWSKKWSGSCFMFDEKDMVNIADILKKWGAEKGDYGDGFLNEYDDKSEINPDSYEKALKDFLKFKKKN